jgi:hypothetical protein
MPRIAPHEICDGVTHHVSRSWRSGLVSSAEQRQKWPIEKELIAPDLYLFKKPCGGQRTQTLRCSSALGDPCFDDIGDTHIGLAEDQIAQFTRVGRLRFAAHALSGAVDEVANGADFCGCPNGRLFDRRQHVQNPSFPCLSYGDSAQQAIIVGLVVDEVAAEIKHRQRKQPLFDKVKDVEHAPGSAIAVRKRMDGFELVVHHGHANVLFRDVLEFRYKLRGERTKGMDETAFFKLVRALPEQEWAAFVPSLRRLMESYGRQVTKHKCTGNFWITGGGEPENWRAALSDAALTLAVCDPKAFEVLRDWFHSDDQEHDNFPANSVFPAIARRSGFATAEAARFGVWFYIYQWQNVFFDPDGMGLLEACKRHWKAEQFALIAAEEARRVGEHEGSLRFFLTDDPSETMLGRLVKGSSSWEITARRALEVHWPNSGSKD